MKWKLYQFATQFVYFYMRLKMKFKKNPIEKQNNFKLLSIFNVSLMSSANVEITLKAPWVSVLIFLETDLSKLQSVSINGCLGLINEKNSNIPYPQNTMPTFPRLQHDFDFVKDSYYCVRKIICKLFNKSTAKLG